MYSFGYINYRHYQLFFFLVGYQAISLVKSTNFRYQVWNLKNMVLGVLLSRFVKISDWPLLFYWRLSGVETLIEQLHFGPPSLFDLHFSITAVRCSSSWLVVCKCIQRWLQMIFETLWAGVPNTEIRDSAKKDFQCRITDEIVI